MDTHDPKDGESETKVPVGNHDGKSPSQRPLTMQELAKRRQQEKALARAKAILPTLLEACRAMAEEGGESVHIPMKHAEIGDIDVLQKLVRATDPSITVSKCSPRKYTYECNNHGYRDDASSCSCRFTTTQTLFACWFV